MGIWLVSMAILTVVTAQEIYDRLYEKSQNFADSVDDFVSSAAQSGRDDFFEYQMLRSIGTSTSIQESSGGHYDSYNHSTDKERHKRIRDINFPMETAVLFYDAEGNLLYGSESDMMYFNYYTQEEWDEGMDTTVGLHYGWIDIREGKNAENRESDPYDYFRTMYGDKGNLSDVSAIRVTGYFEGKNLEYSGKKYLIQPTTK